MPRRRAVVRRQRRTPADPLKTGVQCPPTTVTSPAFSGLSSHPSSPCVRPHPPRRSHLCLDLVCPTLLVLIVQCV